jgi:hypothetical protein
MPELWKSSDVQILVWRRDNYKLQITNDCVAKGDLFPKEIPQS